MPDTFTTTDGETNWIEENRDLIDTALSGVTTSADLRPLPGVSDSRVLYAPLEAYEIAHGQTDTCRKMDDPASWIADNRSGLNDFRKFASKGDTAVGLAANQVNFLGVRIEDRFFAMETSDGWKIVVDPTIVEYHGEPYEALESCLSFPGQKLSAQRYRRITVSYWNEEGEFFENVEMKELDAQIFQHETDHLDGIDSIVVPRDHFTFRNSGRKVGRNEPCPCGSGKKFKKCCS